MPELRERAGAAAVLIRDGGGREHRAGPDRIERWLRLRRLQLRELILATAPSRRGRRAKPGPWSVGFAPEGGVPEDVDDMATKIWGLSKSAANYRPAPKPGVRCEVCKYMFPHLALGGCRLVRGVIQASAICDEFTPRVRQEAG
jgi:hypothetical protein